MSTPTIYSNSVDINLQQLKLSIDARALERLDKSNVSKFKVLVGTLLFYTQIPLIPALGASYLANKFIKELPDVYHVSKTIYYLGINQGLLNYLDGLAQDEKTRSINSFHTFQDLCRINEIVADSRKYYSDVKSNLKWLLAFKIIKVAAIAFLGVAIVTVSAPLMLAGVSACTICWICHPKDYRESKECSDATIDLKRKIDFMLGFISSIRSMPSVAVLKREYISTYPLQTEHGIVPGGGYPYQF
jgi:hypothetical protein